MIRCRLSAVGCRLSAVGCRLSAVGCRLSAVGSQLPAFGSRLSASGFWLSAPGCRLPAVGYRLTASGVPSSIPPSPLRGPLPPDKQWGAREYIGARHLPLDRGGQGRSADFRLPAAGFRLPACLRQSPPRHCVALSPLTSSGAQESI